MAGDSVSWKVLRWASCRFGGRPFLEKRAREAATAKPWRRRRRRRRQCGERGRGRGKAGPRLSRLKPFLYLVSGFRGGDFSSHSIAFLPFRSGTEPLQARPLQAWNSPNRTGSYKDPCSFRLVRLYTDSFHRIGKDRNNKRYNKN